jgi:hypothetical protein
VSSTHTTHKDTNKGTDADIDANVVRFVQLGQQVSTNFRITLPNRATFEAVMAVALGDNNFDPREVARTIGTLFDDAMKVELGAEGSAVLYIEVPFFTGQRLSSPNGLRQRYSDEQRREFTRRVIACARRVGADEVSVQQFPITTDLFVDDEPGEHPYRIRIWWG